MSELLGYARVSTPDQDLESQRQRLRHAGATRIFEDVVSGKTAERPGLMKLLEFARSGDVICVVRLDRLSRSLKQLLESVERLKRQGIGLKSLEESIDTSSTTGEFTFQLFGAIAEFERRLISDRTRDGLAAAKARGRHPGRPPVNDLSLDAAIKLVQAGFSPTNAACQTGLGRSTVYRELRRRNSIATSTFETKSTRGEEE